MGHNITLHFLYILTNNLLHLVTMPDVVMNTLPTGMSCTDGLDNNSVANYVLQQGRTYSVTHSAESCKQMCMNNADCKSYTHISGCASESCGHEQNRCYMMKSCPRFTHTGCSLNDTRHISGVKHGKDPCDSDVAIHGKPLHGIHIHPL